jgi:photosystem II stability/assembly factor-like uncharacterized protein
MTTLRTILLSSVLTLAGCSPLAEIAEYPDAAAADTSPPRSDASAVDASFEGGGAWTNHTRGTSASGLDWTGVASSASGDRVAAVTWLVIPPPSALAGDFFSSLNGGSTWAPAVGGGFSSIVSDATGTHLAAVTEDTEIVTSTDSGMTWSNATPSPTLSNVRWSWVASDATGTRLVGVATFGQIFTSTDGGKSWTDHTPSGPAGSNTWSAAASDATGTHLVAAVTGHASDGGPEELWTSSDGGASWADRTPSGLAKDDYFWAVASDSSGMNLVAVGSGVWTTADGGGSWTRQKSPASSVYCVASDASGKNLIVGSGAPGSVGGDVFTSTDSGVTWNNETAGTLASGLGWGGVASNAAGTHLVAVASGGDIWTN